MEGLIQFSDKYNLNIIFTIGNGQFHPVMTDYALSIDLAHVPDGNILPSPFYRGPVTISEDFEYLIPLGGPVTLTVDDGEPQEYPEGTEIQVEDGARVHIVSGWVKSINLANPPMRDQWKNALCMERKPGGFPSVKPSTPEPVIMDPGWAKSLFPLSKNPKVFVNHMEHETILEEISTLRATGAALPAEVFKASTQDSNLTVKLQTYEAGGFLKSDLTNLRKAMDSYKNAITKAQAEVSEAQISKDELVQNIRIFYEFLGENALHDNKSKKAKEKLEKTIQTLGEVDRATGAFSGYIKKQRANELIHNIKEFIKSSFNAPVGAPPNKVLKLVKDTNQMLEKWRIPLTKANQQDKMERLNQLLVEAQGAANKNQSHNVDDIVGLVNELKEFTSAPATPITPASGGNGKCTKCKEKGKLIADGMCKECAEEHVDEICDYTHNRNHYKQFASPEQIEQFTQGVLGYNSKGHSVLTEEALETQWNDAHNKFLSKKTAKNYEEWVAVANKLKLFFDSFMPESESEEEEEDSSSSSSDSFFDEEEEEEEELPRKKREREDDDSILKAMVYANEGERKKILELHQNGEIKRLRIMVDDLNKRNIIHYRITYFDKNTKAPNDFLTRSEDLFENRNDAEIKAHVVCDRLPEIDFRIDIINGKE